MSYIKSPLNYTEENINYYRKLYHCFPAKSDVSVNIYAFRKAQKLVNHLIYVVSLVIQKLMVFLIMKLLISQESILRLLVDLKNLRNGDFF